MQNDFTIKHLVAMAIIVTLIKICDLFRKSSGIAQFFLGIIGVSYVGIIIELLVKGYL